MFISSQFSIFMVNKPGVLAQVLNAFARAKINIVAMTMMDSAEHGVMRVIFDSATRAREVLSHLNMPYSETDVLCVNLTNEAGALAGVAEKLAKEHVNITYAYCTAGASGGRTTGVFKVADVKKAMKLLGDIASRTAKSQPQVRRSKAAGR